MVVDLSQEAKKNFALLQQNLFKQCVLVEPNNTRKKSKNWLEKFNVLYYKSILLNLF